MLCFLCFFFIKKKQGNAKMTPKKRQTRQNASLNLGHCPKMSKMKKENLYRNKIIY